MPNRLQYEQSPYLLQHAHNPVDWYPWGDEAFGRARQEHKPVLVSIGYAACHWCHVMERESFEDPSVAAFMNEHFICVKVDREEHPDVDHLYMDALQAMTGSGGWPLNMFVTPERKPFYGGTYFPPQNIYGRSSWMEVLGALRRAWLEQQDAIGQQSEQMMQHLRQASLVASAKGLSVDPGFADTVADSLLRMADDRDGGFGNAPKFPPSGPIQFLLEYHHFYKETNESLAAAALEQALLSLDKMIAGGIYDQAGGGFARYATDAQWLVPHFEKMLYDNALLIAVLSKAYRLTSITRYREVLYRTLAFCNRELKAETCAGFYCALDADSEGVEGKFYTWTMEEWTAALPDVHPAVRDYFGVSPAGNWEGTNILHESLPETELLQRHSLTQVEWHAMRDKALERLMTVRESRVRPVTDDKMLLSWNALMNTALTEAAIALEDKELERRAIVHMEWMLDVFHKEDEEYYHVYKNGQARIPAKLDDYAYCIKALWKLASLTGNGGYIGKAVSLTGYVQRHFLQEDHRFFYFSADHQQDIPVRKVELYDGATPSANAVMMENLWVLSNLGERSDWMEQSEAMLAATAPSALRYPVSFARWAIQGQRAVKGRKQLIIAGPSAANYLQEWHRYYTPLVSVMGLAEPGDADAVPAAAGKFRQDGSTWLYVCEAFVCRAPVASVGAALDATGSRQKQ